MADKRNPFAKAIGAKDQASAEARTTADIVRQRDLKQATTGTDDGHASDTPNAVNDNAGSDRPGAGAQFGLGGTGDFKSAADKVRELAPDDEPAEDEPEAVTQGLRDPEAEKATFTEVFGNPAQGDEQETDVASGLLGGLPDPHDRQKTGGERLFDAQTGFADATLAAQDTASTSPVNVAKDPDGKDVTEAGVATTALGLATSGLAAAAGAGGAVLTGAGIVAAGAGATAAGATLALNEATDGAFGDALIKSIPVVNQVAAVAGVVGEAVVAANEVASGASTPTEAVKQVIGGPTAAGGGSTGAASGSGKGGGSKDPGSPDDQPMTLEQRQFAEQMKQELGIRRIQGDVDPADGDGTTGGTQIGDFTDAKAENKNSLVGNPGQAGGSGPDGKRRDTEGIRPGLGQGPDKGGDIDNEDGSGFTGGVHTTGPGDVDFGVGQSPLMGPVGSQSDEDDDSEEDDSDDDSDEDGP
jgi:hypothetical protein